MTTAAALTAVVVDDEPHARRTLRLLLDREPDVRVIGECGDGATAVAEIRRLRPDVVFLDVQIPGADGFEVLRSLEPNAVPAIVFVTAFDEYAVRAFDEHAVDYLLKPFSDERFALVVARVRQVLKRRDFDEIERRLQALLEATSPALPVQDPLVVRDGHRTIVIPLNEIEWIEAEDYYVRVHALGRRPLVRRSLQSLLPSLAPAGFVRVHRSAIVNLAAVREVRPLAVGDHEIVLASGTVVRLSRSFRASFTEQFNAY